MKTNGSKNCAYRYPSHIFVAFLKNPNLNYRIRNQDQDYVSFYAQDFQIEAGSLQNFRLTQFCSQLWSNEMPPIQNTANALIVVEMVGVFFMHKCQGKHKFFCIGKFFWICRQEIFHNFNNLINYLAQEHKKVKFRTLCFEQVGMWYLSIFICIV